MADERTVDPDEAYASYQSKVFQALSAAVDESPTPASRGGAGVPPPLEMTPSTSSLRQEPLAACASPASISSPRLLQRSMSFADRPIFRSTSISRAELKKPLYGGSGSSSAAGSADLEAFLRSSDWDRDEPRPQTGGAETSSSPPCFATEQTAQAAASTPNLPVLPLDNQQHRAKRPFSPPTVPSQLSQNATPASPFDDSFQMPDSHGIYRLDRLTLNGRMLSSPRSFPPRGSERRFEPSPTLANLNESIFPDAAPLSSASPDFSIQAGGAAGSKIRRQSSPGLQSTGGQRPTHRLSSFTSQSSRLSRVASSHARRQSSPGLQSAGVQKPSNRLPSSSTQPLRKAELASATTISKLPSPPRRMSLDVDLNPTRGLLSSPTRSPTRPPSSSFLPKHRCQTDGCNADLSDCKPYVRRYRLCWTCMKSSTVLVDSKAMRFCQQCSRLHELSMFDGKKKSCRAKLVELKQRRMAQ